MDTHTILLSTGIIAICVFLLWLLSVRMKDASIADIWWGPGFAVIAWTTWITTVEPTLRLTILTVIMTTWGIRLSTFMARRNLGHGEDRRYQAMRGGSPHFWWVSLFKVFFLQGGLQIIVALPVFAVAASQTSLHLWDIVGAIIAFGGIFIEALADHQLKLFKAIPANQGHVMDTGLWGYSRHPNYFGNAVLWLGVGLMGIASGGPLWALMGPIIMWFLLLKVSGVAMLEATITDRRPAYNQYINEVSAFIPWPRKQHPKETQ